jgi:hypothetical protein
MARPQLAHATRAAELGDAESVAIATAQIHAEVIGVDRQEMDRLHPILESLLESDAGPRALGWVNFALFGDAYTDARYDEAYERATAVVARGEEINYEYMQACGTLAKLMARSAVERRMTQADLADVIGFGRKIGVHSVGAAALQFVARYAVEIEPDSAGRFLALAERIIVDWDTGRSLEDVLREETLQLLGVTDLDSLMAQTPSVDPVAALDEAAAWVAARPQDEIAPRQLVVPVKFESS